MKMYRYKKNTGSSNDDFFFTMNYLLMLNVLVS